MFPLPQLEGIPLVSGKKLLALIPQQKLWSIIPDPFVYHSPGRACVAFHSYGSSVRCFYPLKNNPNLGTGQGPDTNKVDSSLFRENEVRDACVQTDAGISGVWSHASRGSALANQSNGKCQSSFHCTGESSD